MHSRIISNLLWRFLERCGAQLVTFIVSIVLARILSPDEYGEIAIISVIITILNVFVDGGFANALIQKDEPDDIDFSTVFYFNVVLCVLMYIIVFFLAPLIGWFYDNPRLIPLLKVLALTIIVSGVKNVQHAYVTKHFLFKKFFYSTLCGTVFSAVIGIIMAVNGFGTWSLVAQYLSNLIIDTLILWLTVKWRPSKSFSFVRLKNLFSYGYKLLLSALLNTIYDNFRQLIIGKKYSPSNLAFYNKGKQVPSLLMTNINTSIDSVLFPTMSEKQNDILEVKNLIKKSESVSTYVLWPMVFGLCAIAETLIKILLTEKWIESAPFLRVFCFIYATFPIQTANLNALKAVGRSDLFFKLEIKQTIVGVVLLFIAMSKGPFWIAVMYLLSAIISTFLICNETNRVFNYSFFSQMLDLLPNLGLSVMMLVFVLFLEKMNIGLWFMVVEILLGAGIYILGSIITKNENYVYLINLVKKIFGKQKKSVEF